VNNKSGIVNKEVAVAKFKFPVLGWRDKKYHEVP
jgi:hypothetical protein